MTLRTNVLLMTVALALTPVTASLQSRPAGLAADRVALIYQALQ